MKPRKRAINIRLKDPKDKVAFLEHLEDVEGIDFSVSSKDNLVRIKVYGTREQAAEIMVLAKRIQKELAGGWHAVEDSKGK